MKLGVFKEENFLISLGDKPTPPCTGSGCVGYWNNNGVCVYTGSPPGVGGQIAPPNATVYMANYGLSGEVWCKCFELNDNTACSQVIQATP